MHLFCHLLVSLLLFLCLSPVFDSLYSPISLLLFLISHLLLSCLGGLFELIQLFAFSVRGLARSRAKGLFRSMPVLACRNESVAANKSTREIITVHSQAILLGRLYGRRRGCHLRLAGRGFNRHCVLSLQLRPRIWLVAQGLKKWDMATFVVT